METLDFCTLEEVELLLKSAKNIKHRTMILLLGDAGLRVTEARHLTWANFDFRARTLAVQSLKKKATKKPRKPRIIPVSDRLLDALTDLLQKHPPAEKTGFLFPSTTKPGEPIGRSSVNNMLSKIKHRNPEAGGTSGRLYPHKLRHTFATSLRANGAELEDIRDLLGHENLNTSLIYAHADTTALRLKINASKPALSWRQKLGKFLFRVQKKRLNWVDFDSTQLIGREAEARRITELVNKDVSVLITGSIGIGKTHLIDSLTFEKPVLELADCKDFKKSLAGILLFLFNGDKEQASALFFKDLKEHGKLIAQINKESTPSMCKILMSVCRPYEYILKIGEIDSITPGVVKALEVLKGHFTIVTTTRGVKAGNAGFIWNFERVQLAALSRANTLRLAHHFCQDLEPENGEYLRNKVWDTTEGNPRMIQELCARFRKEPVLDNDTVSEIAGNYIGKHTREIDMSIMLLVIFGALSLLRYMSRENHDPSLRFVGGVAMVLLMFGRHFFNSARRKSF
jgi:hypothetical protein